MTHLSIEPNTESEDEDIKMGFKSNTEPQLSSFKTERVVTLTDAFAVKDTKGTVTLSKKWLDKSPKPVPFLLMPLILAACGGGGGGGGGGGAPAPATDSGVVADGYIAFARVYSLIDSQISALNAGTLDLDSVDYVETDANGAFSGLTRVSGGTTVVVPIAGQSYDVSTLEEFSSIMMAPAGSAAVNPLTTLVSSLVQSGQTQSEAETIVKDTLGIDAAVDITSDLFAKAGDAVSNPLEFAAQQAAAKIAAIALVGAEARVAAGGEADLKLSAQSIFSNIAAELKSLSDLGQKAISSDGNETISDNFIKTAIETGATDSDGVAFVLPDNIDSTLSNITREIAASGNLTSMVQMQTVAASEIAESVATGVKSGSFSVVNTADLRSKADKFTAADTTDDIAPTLNRITVLKSSETPGVSGINEAVPETDELGFSALKLANLKLAGVSSVDGKELTIFVNSSANSATTSEIYVDLLGDDTFVSVADLDNSFTVDSDTHSDKIIITNVDDKFSPATKIAMETSGSNEAAAYDSGDASFNVVDETSDLTFNIAGEGTADLPGLSSFKFVVDFSEQLKFFSGDFFSSDEFTFELATSRGTAVTLNDGGTAGDTSDDTVVQRYVVSATTKEGVDTTESGVITFNNSFKTDSGRVILLEDRNGNTLSTEGQFLFHNGVLSTLDSSELASGISISGFNVDGNKPATPDVSIEDSARLNPTTGVAETGLDTDGITKDAVLNIGTAFENGASVAVRVTTETGSDGDITDWVDWSNATSSLDLVADLSLTLSNGEAYRVDVRQQDASGNYSDILALSFTYDKVIGAINLVNSDSLQDNNLISDDEFTLSVSDADTDSSVKFEYSADGGTTWEALSGGNVAGLADGTYDFKATATDTAGNLAVDQLSNITVDKTAPTLDIKVFVKNESGAWIESTLASVATNDDVKFEFDFSETVTGFDQNDIVISGVDQDAINNGNFSSSSEDYTLELAPTADVASGQISVAVNASSTPGLASGITDTAGNMLSSDVDISASQAFDTKAPTIVSIIGPTAAEYSLGNTVKFTVNFSENIIPMNGSNVQNTVDHKVEFTVGGQARVAYLDENYTNSEKVAWNETNTLEFSYTIVADDGAGGTAENKAVQFDSIKGAYVDSLGNASNVSTLGNPNDFANFTNLYFNGSVSMQQADGYIANSTILAEQPDGTFNVGIGDEIGGAQLFGQAGPMQVFGGQDISTGLDFNVMYESPFGFTVTNPISTLVRSIQKQQTVDTLKVFSVTNGDAALDGDYVFLTKYDANGSPSGKEAIKVEFSDPLYVTAEIDPVALTEDQYTNLTLNPSEAIGVYSLSDAVDNNSDGTPEYIWNNDAWFSINQDAYIKAYPVIFGGSEVIGTWRDLDLSADGFNGIATYDPFAASTDSSATTSDKQDAVSYQRGAASLATFVEVLSDAMATMDSLDLNNSGSSQDQKDWSSEVYAAVSELLVAGNLTTYISSGETVSLSNLLSKETFVQDAIEVVFQIYEPSFSSDNVGNYGEYFEAAKAILTFSGEQIASTYSDTGISDWSALEALTKITQVQQVSQGDSGEILTHFIRFVDDPDSFKNSTNFLNKGNLVDLDILDTSWGTYRSVENGIGYTDKNLTDAIEMAKVGVIVPISYSIENSGAKILREGSSSDDAQTLSFTVTRGGNTEVPSSISWKIKASDYFDVSKFGSETLPTGTIDFDAGDAQKVITLPIKGNDKREFDESLAIELVDDTGMAKLENFTAFVVIQDDDPFTPAIEVAPSLEVGDAQGVSSDFNVDFYDPEQTLTATFEAANGKIELDGEIVSEISGNLKTINEQLSKLKITGVSGEANGELTVTVTTDGQDGADPRSTSKTIALEIHNKASVAIPSEATAVAGKFVELGGMQVGDVDSSSLVVELIADAGKLLVGDGEYNAGIAETSRGYKIDGTVSDINTVLADLQFKGTPGEATGSITVKADDGDPLTTKAIQSFNVSISKAAPEVEAPISAFAKTAIATPIEGVSVYDADSDYLVVKLTVAEGELNFSNEVPGSIMSEGAETGEITVSGTTADLNKLLKSLTYKSVDQPVEDLSISVLVDDLSGTEIGSSKIDLSVLGNAAPDAGGDVTDMLTSTVSEDSDPVLITPQFVKFTDFEEGETSQVPTDIRILSISQGELFAADGTTPLILGVDGDTLSVDGTSYKLVDELYYKPSANYAGEVQIEYVVVDPAISTLTSYQSSILFSVEGVNDAPLLTASSDQSYLEEGAVIAVAPDAVLKDIDFAKVDPFKVTISLTDNNNANDTLKFLGNTTKFSVSDSVGVDLVNASGKEIVLSAKSGQSVTLSDFQQALRDVYFEAADDLDADFDSRTVSIQIDDGAEATLGSPLEVSIGIKTVNDAPELASSATVDDYTENSGAVSLFEDIVVADEAEPSSLGFFKSATVQFSSGYRTGEDSLVLDWPAETEALQNKIEVEFNPQTAALSISSSTTDDISMADLQTVLRYVAYQNSSENPYENTRKVDVVVEDADGASSTTEISKSFAVVRVNDKPVVDLNPLDEAVVNSGVTFTKALYPNGIQVAASATVLDADSQSITAFSVSRTGQDAENDTDNLVFNEAATALLEASGFTIAAFTTSGGTLTASGGNISITSAQDVLRGILFKGEFSDDGDATNDSREIEITLTDGSEVSTVVTSTVTITDAPFAASGGSDITLNGSFGQGGSVVVDMSSYSVIVNGVKVPVETATNLFSVTDLDASSLNETLHNLIVKGSEEANDITGSAGDDLIFGGGGADKIYGGAGNDKILYQASAEILSGGLGDVDAILVSDNFDVMTVSNISDFEIVNAERALSGVNIDVASSDAITSAVGSRYEDTIIIGGGQSATGADGLDTFSLKGDGSSSITISDIETGEVLVLNDLSASAGNWEEIGAESAVEFVEGQTETNLSGITFEKVLNYETGATATNLSDWSIFLGNDLDGIIDGVEGSKYYGLKSTDDLATVTHVQEFEKGDFYIDGWEPSWKLADISSTSSPNSYKVVVQPNQTLSIESMTKDSGSAKDDWVTNNGDAGRIIEGQVLINGMPAQLQAGQFVEVAIYPYQDGAGSATNWVLAKTVGSNWRMVDPNENTETFVIEARVSAEGGLATGASITQSVIFDVIAPEVSSTLLNDTGDLDDDGITNTFELVPPTSLDDTVSLEDASVILGAAEVQYSYDGTTWFSDKPENLIDGNYKIYTRQTDLAGNVSEATSLEVTIDRENPEITLDQSAALNLASLAAPIEITGTANAIDAGQNVNLSLSYLPDSSLKAAPFLVSSETGGNITISFTDVAVREGDVDLNSIFLNGISLQGHGLTSDAVTDGDGTAAQTSISIPAGTVTKEMPAEGLTVVSFYDDPSSLQTLTVGKYAIFDDEGTLKSVEITGSGTGDDPHLLDTSTIAELNATDQILKGDLTAANWDVLEASPVNSLGSVSFPALIASGFEVGTAALDENTVLKVFSLNATDATEAGNYAIAADGIAYAVDEDAESGFIILPKGESTTWGELLSTATSFFDLLLASDTHSATFDANGSEVKAFTLTAADHGVPEDGNYVISGQSGAYEAQFVSGSGTEDSPYSITKAVEGYEFFEITEADYYSGIFLNSDFTAPIAIQHTEENVKVADDGSWKGTYDLGEGSVAYLPDLVELIGEGGLIASANMVDLAGNASNIATKKITFDATAPVITLNPIDDGSAGTIDGFINAAEDATFFVSGTVVDSPDVVRVTVTVSDASGDSLTKNLDVVAGKYSGDFNVSKFANGILKLTANAVDLNGNPALEKTATVELDNVLPELTIDTGLAGTDNLITLDELNGFAISGTTNVSPTDLDKYSDAIPAVKVTLSGSYDAIYHEDDPENNFGSNFEYQAEISGNNLLITFNAATISQEDVEARFLVDGTLVTGGTFVEAAGDNKATYTVTAPTSDTFELSYNYTFTEEAEIKDDGTWSLSPTQSSLDLLPNGPLLIKAEVADGFGNVSTASESNFTVDTQKPVIVMDQHIQIDAGTDITATMAITVQGFTMGVANGLKVNAEISGQEDSAVSVAVRSTGQDIATSKVTSILQSVEAELQPIGVVRPDNNGQGTDELVYNLTTTSGVEADGNYVIRETSADKFKVFSVAGTGTSEDPFQVFDGFWEGTFADQGLKEGQNITVTASVSDVAGNVSVSAEQSTLIRIFDDGRNDVREDDISGNDQTIVLGMGDDSVAISSDINTIMGGGGYDELVVPPVTVVSNDLVQSLTDPMYTEAYTVTVNDGTDDIEIFVGRVFDGSVDVIANGLVETRLYDVEQLSIGAENYNIATHFEQIDDSKTLVVGTIWEDSVAISISSGDAGYTPGTSTAEFLSTYVEYHAAGSDPAKTNADGSNSSEETVVLHDASGNRIYEFENVEEILISDTDGAFGTLGILTSDLVPDVA